MKIKLLIIGALVLFTLTASAQYKEYVVGLKMGPSWNWMSSAKKTASNNQTLVSFNYGVVFDRYFSEKFAFSSGLMVNHVHCNYDYFAKRSVLPGIMPEYETNVHRDLEATYLCIPALFKAKFVEIGGFDCYVQGGFDFGFRLKAMAKDACLIGVYQQNDKDYSDARNDYKMFHTSFDLGIGTEYKIQKSVKVFGQLVYNRAITNLTSNDYSGENRPVLLPNYFAFEFGVLF